jgi:HTH-type transcriptional regulator / antitoxin HipB
MEYVARTPEQLGQILRSYRKQRDLTQQETANKVGIKQATLSNAENDTATTSVETLYKICSALGLELVVRDLTTVRKAGAANREW